MTRRIQRWPADRADTRVASASCVDARVVRLVCLVALPVTGTSCDEERPVTVVEPLYADACKFVECSTYGVCAEDEAGNGQCHCLVGHAGSDCARCEPGFHRDAHDRCVSDRHCDELVADPCAPHGECVAEQGVITCSCAIGYEGPRCNLCADGYRWVGSATCVRVQAPGSMDASADDDGAGDGSTGQAGAPDANLADARTDAEMLETGRPDTGAPEGGAPDAAASEGGMSEGGARDGGRVCPITTMGESFDALSGVPAIVNTCVTRAQLTIPGVLVRSRAGDGTVQLCAGSSITQLTTPHIQVEADPTRPAELQFAEAASFVSLKCAALLQAVSVEILADGRSLRTLELARKSAQSLELLLDPPATTIVFRSRTPYLQNVALDDVTHRGSRCE